MKDQSKTSIPATPDRPASEFISHPSTSLQTVIKHNEDLMARLSVTLRRVGHLEKVIEDVTMRFKVEKSNSDTLRDELLIYTEKNRLSDSQLQKNFGDISRLKKTTETLGIENQSLKSELISLESKYEFKLSQLELEISELKKIKEDTDINLRPKLGTLMQQVMNLESNLNEIQNKNDELKEKLLSISQQAQAESLKFQNTSKVLSIKLKEKDLIISRFEALDEKLKVISKEKTQAENKIIDLEHELIKINSNKTSELEKHQFDLSTKNSEIQKLKIENYELKKSWAESSNKTKDLEQKLNVLNEQSQTMQFMWQEKNRKQSQIESQLKIHESMRHELSLKANALEQELKSKSQKVSDLLELVETMKYKGQHEKDSILETAIRGIRNLSFIEEEKNSTDFTGKISF